MYVVFYGFNSYRDKRIVEYPEKAKGIKVRGERPKNVYIHSDTPLTKDQEHWVFHKIIPKLHKDFNKVEYSKGCKRDS